LTVNTVDGTINILLGYDNGSFAASTIIPIGPCSPGFAVIDFNGYSPLDFVVAS